MKKARKLLSDTFRPTRGGDGGLLPRDVDAMTKRQARLGIRRAVAKNACVFPTVAPAPVCLPTRSQVDRAHDEKLDGKLLRGDRVPTATPRQYPEHEFHTPIQRVGTTTDGTPVLARDLVHMEQVFDATEATTRWLAQQGLEVNGRAAATTERAAMLFGSGFRDATRQLTKLWKS
jgi:hypothetical protein